MESRQTNLQPSDEGLVRVKHDDEAGAKLGENLIIAIIAIWSYHNDLLWCEESVIFVKRRLVKLSAEGQQRCIRYG